jgi:MFS family permease
MNKIIRFLMISDIFVVTGFGLIDPILAIYLKENLVGGTIFAAGIASMLFLVTKSIVQLPFSKYVDSHEKKIRWLVFGTFLVALVPFMYIFAKNIQIMYVAQILQGIGSGLAYPTWLSLWSKNLDKNHEAFEWSIYSTSTGIGTAIAAAIGAAIAEFIGFAYTFALVGLMALVGCGILFLLEERQHHQSLKNSKKRASNPIKKL